MLHIFKGHILYFFLFKCSFRVQKELTDVIMTFPEFRNHLYTTIKTAIPHKWNMDWRSQVEKLGFRWVAYYDELSSEEVSKLIAIFTDFGALVSAVA